MSESEIGKLAEKTTLRNEPAAEDVSVEMKDKLSMPFDPARTLEKLLQNSVVEVMESLETMWIYTKNLLQHPDEKKYRKIKISNIHYQERLGHLNGALEAMEAIGYVPVGEYLRLDEKRMAPGILREENAKRLRQIEQFIIAKIEDFRKEWGTLPNRLSANHTYKSVLGAACYSAIGKRNSMEDDEIMLDSFCNDPQQGYFGLYDGHGGRATVDFVVKALHMNMEQSLMRKPDMSVAEAFKQSYLTTDSQLRRNNILRSGTTSVTCVIRNVNDKRVLFTANVGDSRAVLCRSGKAIRLTVDHKPSLPEEAKRITDAGGFIGRNKRVNGVLAISRALGDHMLKDNEVVSAEPFCAETELTEADDFIVLACDGVWDVMSDQDAIDFVAQKYAELEPKLLASRAGSGSATAGTDMDVGYVADHNVSNPGSPMSVPMLAASSANGSDNPGNFSPAHELPLSSMETGDLKVSNGDSDHIPQSVNDVLYLTAKALVTHALDLRSLDNVTVMIIKLR